jgi:hypothetical protein
MLNPHALAHAFERVG